MKLNVLQRFTFLSIGATVVIVVGLGILVWQLTSAWLLDHEVTITAEALQTVTSVDLPPETFARAVADPHHAVFLYIWQHFQQIRGVLHARIYDSDGKEVWSDDGSVSKEASGPDSNVRTALHGQTSVRFGRPRPGEVRGRGANTDLLDLYMPLVASPGGPAYGVVELYRFPVGFVRSRRVLLYAVCIGGAVGGAVLYLSLFSLFRGALREQMRLEKVERQFAELELELKVAGTIQKGLLPSVLPEAPGFALAAHHKPSRQIGGDYYDAFKARDGTLVLVVADSEGKGIPGALMMAEVRQLLRATVDAATCACTTVQALNDPLSADGGPARLVTMFLARLEPAAGMLRYCCAGHLPALVARDGKVLRLDAGGPPLGATTAAAYEEGIFRLAPGDTLLLYTDGITEATNAQGELFGTKRLEELLVHPDSDNSAGGDAAAGVIQRVNAAVAAFAGGQTAADDETMLCLAVGP